MKFNRSVLWPPSTHSDSLDSQEPSYFFIEENGTSDPSTSELQRAIVRLLPLIRNHVQRMFRDDSRAEEVVDRLYSRLRNANLVGDISDSAIWSRLVSIVHEERRRERRRFGTGAEGTRIEAHVDPESLAFVTELVRKDQLRAFRDCLDSWTRQVFDLRFSSPEPSRSKELSQRFGLKQNAFDQRWRRGIQAGIDEFRRRLSA